MRAADYNLGTSAARINVPISGRTACSPSSLSTTKPPTAHRLDIRVSQLTVFHDLYAPANSRDAVQQFRHWATADWL